MSEPRKPEPYRATTRGNILKVVRGDVKHGSRAKDAVAAKARMLSAKSQVAAIQPEERRRP